MINDNYLRISSLEDDSLLLTSRKRSKSSSNFSMVSKLMERKDLRDKRNISIHENIKNMKEDKLSGQIEKIENRETSKKIQNNKNIINTNLSNDIDDSQSVNFSIHSTYFNNYDKTQTYSNNQHNSSLIKYKINPSNKKESKKGYKEYVEKEEYLELKFKQKELKEKYKKLFNQEINWRSSYFNLLKDSIQYDEAIKNLIEENRIHQEYIISLENKLNKILTSCNNITSSFHNNLMQLSNLDTTANNNLSNTLLKNYNEIINDYKQQIEILAEEKENLSTSLSITRHQQLQNTMKLEGMQKRILFMEQARLEDMKILQNNKDEQKILINS